MVRGPIEVHGREYFIIEDDPVPLSRRILAIIQARLVNLVTREPITSPVRFEKHIKELSPRISRDGLVGFAGIPARVFPVLAGKNFKIEVHVIAEGYLPRTVTVTIPSDRRTTVVPLPQKGDRTLRLTNTARLLPGEMLMIGNPITNPGTQYEEVRIAMLGPGVREVTIRSPFTKDHHRLGPEPVVPVVPANFAPVNHGDILLTPSP